MSKNQQKTGLASFLKKAKAYLHIGARHHAHKAKTAAAHLSKPALAAGAVTLLMSVISLVTGPLFNTILRYRAEPSVVQLSLPGIGHGSGFHVASKSGKRYIITNNHVCDMASQNGYLVASNQGSSPVTYNVRILKQSDKTDLCAVEAIPGVSPLSVSKSVATWDEMYITGYPGRMGLTVFKANALESMTADFLNGIIDEGKRMTPPSENAKSSTNPLRNFAQNSPYYTTGDSEFLTEQQCKKHGYHSIIEEEMELFIFKMKVKLCISSVRVIMASNHIFAGNSGGPVFNIFQQVSGVAVGQDGNKMGLVIPASDLTQFISELE